ncbi:MAG: preprotein translocase subunit SecG [Pseudomonadota bacterium]
MTTVIITIHIMLVLALIVLVLLQRSEGGALGIGGGGGGGGGMMSARGAANALTRTTTIVAAGFFLTSVALGVIAKNENRTEDVLRQVEGAAQSGVPSESEGAAVPSAGSLLDDLQNEGNNTGVPTAPSAPSGN